MPSPVRKVAWFQCYSSQLTLRQISKDFPACWILIGQFKFRARQPYARPWCTAHVISTVLGMVIGYGVLKCGNWKKFWNQKLSNHMTWSVMIIFWVSDPGEKNIFSFMVRRCKMSLAHPPAISFPSLVFLSAEQGQRGLWEQDWSADCDDEPCKSSNEESSSFMVKYVFKRLKLYT